jgi:hypothetical protein
MLFRHSKEFLSKSNSHVGYAKTQGTFEALACNAVTKPDVVIMEVQSDLMEVNQHRYGSTL